MTHARATSPFAGFEFLESRRMLAATGAATLDADGVLSIEGTRGNDTIEVNQYLGKGGQPTLDVRVNGRSLGVFRVRHVSRMEVLGGLGDDQIRVGAFFAESTGTSTATITFSNEGNSHTTVFQTPVQPAAPQIRPLTIPATILAGGGRDTVLAGDGEDYIEGGDGNDVLSGNGGDDRILGQDGDDSVYGGAGSDTLEGSTGRDDLDGNGGISVFVAAGGNTTGAAKVTLSGSGSGTLFFNNTRSGLTGGYFYIGVLAASPGDVDAIIGNQGGDTFHKGDRASEMRDFNAGVDKVV